MLWLSLHLRLRKKLLTSTMRLTNRTVSAKILLLRSIILQTSWKIFQLNLKMKQLWFSIQLRELRISSTVLQLSAKVFLLPLSLLLRFHSLPRLVVMIWKSWCLKWKTSRALQLKSLVLQVHLVPSLTRLTFFLWTQVLRLLTLARLEKVLRLLLMKLKTLPHRLLNGQERLPKSLQQSSAQLTTVPNLLLR